MTDKHTPGPWKVFKHNDFNYVGIGEKNGEGICDSGIGLWRDGPEALANAHLIAAAPAMYGILKKAQEFFCSEHCDPHGEDPCHYEECDDMRLVLAAARGEQEG